VKSLLHTKPESEEFNKIYSRIGKYEEISDRMEIEIANYLNKVIDGRLSYEGKLKISAMMNIVSEIESIADSCNNLGRTMVRQHEAKIVFNEMVVENIETMFKYVSEALDNMLLILREIETANEKDIMESYNKEREINNYRNSLRSENVENVNQKIYPYEEGIFYMDIICESEKLGDYIVNVVDGVKSQNEEVEAK
jgi:phosphate:Na+ symporter